MQRVTWWAEMMNGCLEPGAQPGFLFSRYFSCRRQWWLKSIPHRRKMDNEQRFPWENFTIYPTSKWAESFGSISKFFIAAFCCQFHLLNHLLLYPPSHFQDGRSLHAWPQVWESWHTGASNLESGCSEGAGVLSVPSAARGRCKCQLCNFMPVAKLPCVVREATHPQKMSLRPLLPMALSTYSAKMPCDSKD